MVSTTPIQVLLIEDEEFDVRRVRNTLAPFESTIRIREIASSGHAALEILRKRPGEFDVVIMDFQIAGGLMGENLIREIKTIDPLLQIVVVTKMTVNVADVAFATSLLAAGASWYCTKYPADMENYIYQPTDFVLSIVNAHQKRVLQKAHKSSTDKLLRNVEEMLRTRTLLGRSRATEMLREQVERCASSDASVLITGLSGTGKEVIATNIHYRSRRKFENFVPVNCGGLPHDLIESELFGYEKGAFTGADTPKQGLFEFANGGTLFLDEIGELPLSAQVKLLRVLQDGEIEKIGRSEKLKVDVRIIAATNKDLEMEVKERRFREDLYYRLNVVPIYVPPLRQRPEDVLDIFQHFLSAFSAEMGRTSPGLDEGVAKVLTSYAWPGNVRELKNVVQRLLLSQEEEITPWHLKEALGSRPSAGGAEGDRVLDVRTTDPIVPWKQMEHLCRERYFRFVREGSASDSEAAKKLGLARSNYHRMCKEMGLK